MLEERYQCRKIGENVLNTRNIGWLWQLLPWVSDLVWFTTRTKIKCAMLYIYTYIKRIKEIQLCIIISTLSFFSRKISLSFSIRHRKHSSRYTQTCSPTCWAHLDWFLRAHNDAFELMKNANAAHIWRSMQKWHTTCYQLIDYWYIKFKKYINI